MGDFISTNAKQLLNIKAKQHANGRQQEAALTAPVPPAGESFGIPFKVIIPPQRVDCSPINSDKELQFSLRQIYAMIKPPLGKLSPRLNSSSDKDRSLCYVKVKAVVVDGRVTAIAPGSRMAWKSGAYPGQAVAQRSTGTGALPFAAGSQILQGKPIRTSPRGSIHSVASSRNSSVSSVSVADSIQDASNQMVIFTIRSTGDIQDVKQAYYNPCIRGPFETYSPTDPLFCPGLVPDKDSFTCNVPFSITAKTETGATLAYERDVSHADPARC